MKIPEIFLEIRSILDIFADIGAIPRCSGNEAKIASWLRRWARKQGFESLVDQAGNVVIRIPASPGREQAPTLILQNHMDMVCEKDPASCHDFSRDPLQLIVEGDWLRADGTSLGADNGLGMAIALALAADGNLLHPELELLFTVEEETGLAGAQKLDPSLLRGRRLINIDSEKEGVFTIGCAGGENIHLELPVTREPLPADWVAATITVGGLRGGHSGMDIAKGRGNANRILAEILDGILKAADFKILSLQGGTRSNAIPRQAEAVIAFHPNDSVPLTEKFNHLAEEKARRLASVEPKFTVSLSSASRPQPDSLALSPESMVRCLRLLTEIPNGVRRMEKDRPDMVATSNNLAVVRSEKGKLKVLSLQRSSRMAELEALTREIAVTASQLGASAATDGLYPAWEPEPDSQLLGHCLAIYREIFAADPSVHITHGGLECGILGAKLPGAEMVSLGPDIENPHSPGERAFLPSIARVHRFLRELLTSFP